MKKVKGIAAFAAAAMALNSATVVLAQSSNAKGIGSFEGNVSDDIVSGLIVPTIADETLNFILDPNELIKNTAAAKYKPDNEYVQFENGKHFFFKNADNNYSSRSDEITVKNNSSKKVDVTVEATLSKYDGITLSGSEDFSADDEGKMVYIALNKQTTGAAVNAAMTETGCKLNEALDGVADTGFDYTYNTEEEKYEKVLKDNVDGQSYTFYLNGEANPAADWSSVSNSVKPELDLIWSLENHVGNTNPGIAETEFAISTTQNTTLALNYGTGQSAATGITSVKITGTSNSSVNNSEIIERSTYINVDNANGTITFKPGFYSAMNTAGVTTGTITVTFNNTLTATGSPDDEANAPGATTASFTFTFE